MQRKTFLTVFGSATLSVFLAACGTTSGTSDEMAGVNPGGTNVNSSVATTQPATGEETVVTSGLRVEDSASAGTLGQGSAKIAEGSSGTSATIRVRGNDTPATPTTTTQLTTDTTNDTTMVDTTADTTLDTDVDTDVQVDTTPTTTTTTTTETNTTRTDTEVRTTRRTMTKD